MTARVLSRNERDPATIALVVNELASGRSNAHGTFTLTTSTTSTVVTNANCAAASCVKITPTTANAAGALATTYITAANGSFTITHASNSQTDRTFTYAIQG
jgi:hypothetical protein